MHCMCGNVFTLHSTSGVVPVLLLPYNQWQLLCLAPTSDAET